ncbi:uncharacterized protein LOC121604285 [Chelmon rostratus]|uniref:uncharacterized protein LOC121604285 n=1 Tax=Chelmon rostratus TaxID=109905 RepID=UPI001BE9AFEE|nr:uncharacterized protein LOC121604285 [Chelmon rostratus]
MKLGLLVVLAVAVVAPNLSEGRIVSRCELREKLGEAMVFFKRFQGCKERLLATVICEVEMSSHLNSSLVRVVSQRRTATPKLTTTTPAISEPSEADAPNPTSESNPTAPGAGGVRARRDADTSSLEDMPDEEESQSDEEELEQDEDAVDSSDEESDEDEEEGDEDEQELEEGGKRKKRFSLKWRPRRKRGPRSQSFYGLFQLSDRHYCESLHHRSKNRCETTCEAFTDDDIEDDIDCLVKTGLWRFILRHPSHGCRHIRGFFDECDLAVSEDVTPAVISSSSSV